jgi:nucleoid-associated protein YgaU
MARKNLLLALLLVLTVAAGCARPPVVNIEDVQSVVTHAYASGAAHYAPGEYQLASSALQAAEQQLANGESRKALNTLELARRYASEAIRITLSRKQQILSEQQRQAEVQRQAELEKERRQQLERQAELQLQRELEAARERQAEQQAKREQAEQQRKAQAVKKTQEPPKPRLVAKIEVTAGENLASIAAKSEVFADALLWPLIYKANRDQIKDPQKIFAGQVLVIPRDKTPEEKQAARKEARELNLF